MTTTIQILLLLLAVLVVVAVAARRLATPPEVQRVQGGLVEGNITRKPRLEHAPLLANGEDATFQNKVHLALAARGFLARTRTMPPEKAP